MFIQLMGNVAELTCGLTSHWLQDCISFKLSTTKPSSCSAVNYDIYLSVKPLVPKVEVGTSRWEAARQTNLYFIIYLNLFVMILFYYITMSTKRMYCKKGSTKNLNYSRTFVWQKTLPEGKTEVVSSKVSSPNYSFQQGILVPGGLMM